MSKPKRKIVLKPERISTQEHRQNMFDLLSGIDGRLAILEEQLKLPRTTILRIEHFLEAIDQKLENMRKET